VSLPIAILAGGLATRLRPITQHIPKSLVPVGGRPFLAHQLELLRARGIRRVVLCVGHLGEMIQREFGDGEAYGVEVSYSFDGPVLLGTGGALKQALPLLGPKFLVLYGDSYLPIDYLAVSRAFEQSGKPGLMTVYRNEGRYDTSNVVFAEGVIQVYDKQTRRPDLQHIDYGLSALCATAFDAFPPGQKFDLADLLQRLVAARQLAGFEVRERFYEIGSSTGLAELNALLSARAVSNADKVSQNATHGGDRPGLGQT
jgi:NDP-sugar pyrophosphorylase family protein